MKNLERRLEDLESQPGQEPVEYVLVWADPDEDYSKPSAPGTIRLRWPEDL